MSKKNKKKKKEMGVIKGYSLSSSRFATNDNSKRWWGWGSNHLVAPDGW